MNIHAVRLRLGDLVRVRAGYPFRSAIPEVPQGRVRVVQMKDLHPLHGAHWEGMVRTELSSRSQPDWLVPDDLLFVARGARFYAVWLNAVPVTAVAGVHLYHLRLKPGVDVHPGFLAWQLNQAPFQKHLRRAAEGSSQLSVRRPVLESLPLSVPSIECQQGIVALAALLREERELALQLERNRQRQLDALADVLDRAAGSATPAHPSPASSA